MRGETISVVFANSVLHFIEQILFFQFVQIYSAEGETIVRRRNVDNCLVNDVEGFTFCLYEWVKWFGVFFAKVETFDSVWLKMPLAVLFSGGDRSTRPLQYLCVTYGLFLSLFVGFFRRGLLRHNK